MVKCNKDQVERLKKALKRETDPVVRQRIQMALLREDGKTQPQYHQSRCSASPRRSAASRSISAHDNNGSPDLTIRSRIRRSRSPSGVLGFSRRNIAFVVRFGNSVVSNSIFRASVIRFEGIENFQRD